MGLKIEEQNADALTFRIAKGLKDVSTLVFGLYISDFRWAEVIANTLPEALNGRLTKICGEGGLADFLHGQIVHTLEEDKSYIPYETDRLIDTDSYKDTLVSARKLVTDLSLLPYSYRIVAPLPSSFSADFFEVCDDFELGPGMFLMRGSKVATDFSLETGILTRDKRIFRSVNDALRVVPSADKLYFVQKRSGYVGQQKEPPIIAEFNNSLRQLLGAILAVKGFRFAGWRAEQADGAIFVHRVTEGSPIVRADRLTPQIRDFYSETSPPENAELTTPLKAQRDKYRRKLEAIKSVFLLNDHGRRLSVAAIWYLRSHISKDSLDGLLESTIALEALLGGGNADGNKLSMLLGNRCAYLVGKSLTDRQEILSKFTEIYNLRSRIVHEGHHHFTKFERELLNFSRELCRRALVKEMMMTAALE